MYFNLMYFQQRFSNSRTIC